MLHKSLTERLEILKEFIPPTDNLVMLESYEDGHALFEAKKTKDSPYLLGKRALWLKNKHFTIETVEVIEIRKGDFVWGLAQVGKYLRNY